MTNLVRQLMRKRLLDSAQANDFIAKMEKDPQVAKDLSHLRNALLGAPAFYQEIAAFIKPKINM